MGAVIFHIAAPYPRLPYWNYNAIKDEYEFKNKN